MRMSFSVTIAKRGLKLGLMYVALAAFITVLGVFLSGLGSLIPRDTGNLPSTVNLNAYIGLIGVPLVSMGALMAAMPVTMLFVHDKDNGTLEYLLSMGFDQRDIFRTYLAASVMLGLPLLVVGGVAASLVDLLTGGGIALAATVLVCIFALGLAVIALTTVLMTAFSALQKQPVGMNQPLGIAIGAFVLVGAMMAPLAAPADALVFELVIAAVVVAGSLGLLSATPRLIRREKMLP